MRISDWSEDVCSVDLRYVGRLALEIAREIEEIGFEQFAGRIEGRADTEVRRAAQHAAAGQPPAHRVDAVSGAHVIGEPEDGGGIAEITHALVPHFDPAPTVSTACR